MNTLDALKTRLNAHKRTGRGAEIANTAGCHYFTVARIARGALTNPSFKLVDGIATALDAIDRDDAKALRRALRTEPAPQATTEQAT